MTYTPREYNYLRNSINCPFCNSSVKKSLFEKLMADEETIQVSLKCRVCKLKWVDHLTNQYLKRLELIAYRNSSLLSKEEYDNILKEIEFERLKQGYSL